MASTLGAESTLTLTDLTELILLAKTSEEMHSLIDAQRKLAAHTQVLIDHEIAETLPEYRKAIAALKVAGEAAEKAKEDLDKIADYISKVGRAIGLVGKLVGIVSGVA